MTVTAAQHYTANVGTNGDWVTGPWLHWGPDCRLTVRAASHAPEGSGFSDFATRIVDDLGIVGQAKMRAADVEDAFAEVLAAASAAGWRVMARLPQSYRDGLSGRTVHGPGEGSPMLPFDRDDAVIDLAESTHPLVPEVTRERDAYRAYRFGAQ